MHAPQHMDGEPDPVVLAVGGHRVAADHPHLLVLERLYEAQEGLFGAENVVRVQHDDQPARLSVQICVYGRVFPLSFLLDDQTDVSVLFLELAYYVVGAVRASAGHYDDFFDPESRRLL